MENNKKRINIIDLIALILLIAVVVFGVYKITDIKNIGVNAVKAKVVYTVEVQNENPEIMNYINVDDKVFEDESLKSLGTVLDVTQRPYKLVTEDKENKRVLMQEKPNTVAVDIKIAADADKVNGNLSVDSINILVGKTIDLNVGNSYVEGVIIDVNDMSEEKEAQK
ncbi:MAG: DUF4330 family protein [Clostridia bacterium]|nr:DUF4330 family protein [Clostridia bacterium]